jgi:hypothetical protein
MGIKKFKDFYSIYEEARPKKVVEPVVEIEEPKKPEKPEKVKIDKDVKSYVLDRLIDNDGKVHDFGGYIVERNDNEYVGYDKGKRGFGTRPLRKIVSDDWDSKTRDITHEYPAGLDKNGELITFNFNERDEVLNNNGDVLYRWNQVSDGEGGVSYLPTNEPWKISKRVSSLGVKNMLGRGVTYLDEMAKLPTGWINVKIDMEVIRKIKRFSVNLSNGNTPSDFMRKLKYLSDPKKLIGNNKYGDDMDITESIQRRMSAIMLLRYIKEIKDYFNPSQSGFLFESFIAGLIPGVVPDDNSFCDVIGDDKTKYQIKFIEYKADNISLEFSKDPKKWCDYYIIALKEHNRIHIWRLAKDMGSLAPTVRNPRSQKSMIDYYMTPKSGISVAKLKENLNESIYTKIDLIKIDSMIDEISHGLENTIENLWNNVSDLQYNIETILTGVDKSHKRVTEDEYYKLYDSSNKNLGELSNLIGRLKTSMR